MIISPRTASHLTMLEIKHQMKLKIVLQVDVTDYAHLHFCVCMQKYTHLLIMVKNLTSAQYLMESME
jgi:hypothetical protein